MILAEKKLKKHFYFLIKLGTEHILSKICPKQRIMAYKIEREEERCLACGKELYGRPDKKFCDRKCKNDYHNSLIRDTRLLRNRIVTALSVNYRILEELLEEGRTSVSLEDLAAIGFNQNYITAHRRGRHQHEEYSCFDIRYYQSSSKIFNIRRGS